MAQVVTNYKYIARNTDGSKRSGIREASCPNDVLVWLREQGLTPVSVTELARNQKTSKTIQNATGRIKSSELAALSWQLTTMVEGGIPIITALDTICEDTENRHLQKIIRTVSEKMQRGEALSECLAEYPRVFNKLATSIILAGETSGNLAGALHKLAEYFDSRDKFTRKVSGAMVYPIFVVVFIIGIVAFIMAFIIPRFIVIFEQFDNELPAFTAGFMAFYNWICHNILLIIGGGIGIFITGVLMSKTKQGHYALYRILLSIPLIGRIVSQAFIVVFCRTMSTLLGAGVSVLEAFDILLTMTSNDIIQNAIRDTKQKVVAGANISSSLVSSGFFPRMVAKMVQVGEESGSMTKVLDRTSDYYERKVDSMISAMLALMEPIMIIVVGGIVLVVLLALYLPIFKMAKA